MPILEGARGFREGHLPCAVDTATSAWLSQDDLRSVKSGETDLPLWINVVDERRRVGLNRPAASSRALRPRPSVQAAHSAGDGGEDLAPPTPSRWIWRSTFSNVVFLCRALERGAGSGTKSARPLRFSPKYCKAGTGEPTTGWGCFCSDYNILCSCGLSSHYIVNSVDPHVRNLAEGELTQAPLYT